MEWIIQNGDESKRVESIEDIATIVKSVMEQKSEFLILITPEPINLCNFMQIAPGLNDDIHFEVSLIQNSEKTHVFSKTCSPDVAITLLTLFYTENAVPIISDWTFVGEYGL